LGLVLPRPAPGAVPHRPPPQSRRPHPSAGESFAGTFVSDFYAAYNGLDCVKQRRLVHLLRELARLREELPWQSVRAFIQPLIELFQNAIQLGKDREKLDGAAFSEAYRRLIDRFDDLMLRTHSQHPDCVRIWKRLY
jgi:hypothetical protein